MRFGPIKLFDWTIMQGQPSGLQDPGVWCDTDVGMYEVITWSGDIWEWRISVNGKWKIDSSQYSSRENAAWVAEQDYIKRVLNGAVLDWQLADSSTFVDKDQIIFNALSGAYQVFYEEHKKSWIWRKWDKHFVTYARNSHATLKAAIFEAEADYFESLDPVKELTALNNILVNGGMPEVELSPTWGPKERSSFNDLVGILTGKGG